MKELITIVMACLTVSVMAQEKPDYQSIADKIVNQSLDVKTGEVVVVTGTPAELELIEALVVEIAKAGGHYSVELDLPTANHCAIMETPIEYLEMVNPYPLLKARLVDCYISAGSVQDPTLFSDVPEEKLKASRSANMALRDAFNRAKFRAVYIGQTGGIPSESYANMVGMNYADMLNNFWKAIDTNYELMHIDSEVLKKYLAKGREMTVSSEEGTMLTFRISDTGVRTNCGDCTKLNNDGGPTSAWLPAGEVYTCVDPQSANGLLVIPHYNYRGDVMTNLRISFENGIITDLTADGNVDNLMEALKSNPDDKNCLSIFDIGINRDRVYTKGSRYASWEMAGMLTFYIGDNTWAGGTVSSQFSMGVHAPFHTLKAGKTEIISKGEIVMLDDMADK
ncbi:aminopeptidase [Carboxylicivirga mesophila]|uniref:Aminopeptidase n=1 Tax=Carboxylicivirga mesophila TaxID=1166478 RepID=A0ABS5K5X5_9BACT|nr:aminopeptidase [Carboxylicivirga mesophila]MBS2210399.1 aminopeptidase [Carboxylicivirga mesophila]